MKLLVVGIENLIGKKIIPQLLQHKHDLWIVLEDSADQAIYQQMGLHVIVADIRQNGQWIDTIPQELEAIVNLTIPTLNKRLNLKTIENDIAPEMLRIGQNLCHIASARKSERIIQLTNIFYYSQRGTTELSERSPRDFAPDNYGLTYSSLTSYLFNQKDIQTTVCVAGHYIYDSDGVTIPQIPRIINNFVICGTGENEIQLTHIDDLVGGLIHIIENNIREQVVNIVDNKPMLQKDFLKLLSHVYKTGSPLPFPVPLASFIFGDAYPKSISQSIVLKNGMLKESGYWFRFPDYTAGFATHLMR